MTARYFHECIHGLDWQYCDECCPLGRERATRHPHKIPRHRPVTGTTQAKDKHQA